MCDYQANQPTRLLEMKSRLIQQIQEKSKLLNDMHLEVSRNRFLSVQDFPGQEDVYYEREEYMIFDFNDFLRVAERMISETEDVLSSLKIELEQVEEEFMVRTTVVFPLEFSC